MNASDRRVYVSGIAVALGGRVRLDDVTELADAAGLVADLRKEGIEHICVAPHGVCELAASSLAAAAGSPPNRPKVGALVYSTTTRWEDAARIAADAGLATVPIIGVGRNACANLGPALRVARSLLLAEDDAEAVAVTLADGADGRKRLMDGHIGVLSDGAASCVVTRAKPTNGWALSAIQTASECRLALNDDHTLEVGARLAHSMGRQINAAVRRLEAGTGLRISDYDIVLMNHYTTSTLEAFAQLLGVSTGRIYGPNRSTVSHCFGIDPLVDLASLEDDDPPVGSRAVVLVCGPGVWTLLSLERI